MALLVMEVLYANCVASTGYETAGKLHVFCPLSIVTDFKIQSSPLWLSPSGGANEAQILVHTVGRAVKRGTDGREAAIAHHPQNVQPWMALGDLRDGSPSVPRNSSSHEAGGIKSDATCLVCPAHLTLRLLWEVVATIPRSGKPFLLALHTWGASGIWSSEGGGPWANLPSFRHDGTTLQEMRRGLPDDPGTLGTTTKLRISRGVLRM